MIQRWKVSTFQQHYYISPGNYIPSWPSATHYLPNWARDVCSQLVWLVSLLALYNQATVNVKHCSEVERLCALGYHSPIHTTAIPPISLLSKYPGGRTGGLYLILFSLIVWGVGRLQGLAADYEDKLNKLKDRSMGMGCRSAKKCVNVQLVTTNLPLPYCKDIHRWLVIETTFIDTWKDNCFSAYYSWHSENNEQRNFIK